MGAIHTGQSRGNTFAGYSNLEVEVCTCGVLFAAPAHMLDSKRQTGETFYCPNGHGLVYDSENEKLKRQLNAERDRAATLRAHLDQEEARTRALKGVVTKTKKKLAGVELRVANGVCPCCGRHLQATRPAHGEQAPRVRRAGGRIVTMIAEYVYVVDLKVQVFARDEAHADELAGEAAEAVRRGLGDEALHVVEVGEVRRRGNSDQRVTL